METKTLVYFWNFELTLHVARKQRDDDEDQALVDKLDRKESLISARLAHELAIACF